VSDAPGEGYVYRYSQLLKRLLTAKGGEPITELAPELLAAIILENDRPEYHYLGNSGLWGVTKSQAAVAGQLSYVGVNNPSGSGVLLVVVLAELVNATGANQGAALRFNPAPGSILTQTTMPFRERRLSAKGTTSRVTTGSEAASSGVDDLALPTIPNATTYPYLGGAIPMQPGQHLIWQGNVVNTQIQAHFAGYERPLEQSET